LTEREVIPHYWDHPLVLRATTRKKKNNIHSNQLNAYFHQLEKKLMDKEELLLMGPGVTKTHFFHHLQDNKHFSKLKIEVIDADKMSVKQLLAKVKHKFSPSS
jgi:stalled ribosome rescue protein Dom34